MEISWIEHKGKKILLTDYTGIKMEKEMVAHLEKVVPLVESLEKGSKILMLVDLTGCYATPGFISRRTLSIPDHVLVGRHRNERWPQIVARFT
jgi:hypothetical protein